MQVCEMGCKMGLWNFQVKFSEAQVHQGNIYLNIFNLWQVANLVVSQLHKNQCGDFYLAIPLWECFDNKLLRYR